LADVTSTCRQASIDATSCENTFEANKMFGNAILDGATTPATTPATETYGTQTSA
jgi:hypothetical protein